jgi:hypothetical protein
MSKVIASVLTVGIVFLGMPAGAVAVPPTRLAPQSNPVQPSNTGDLKGVAKDSHQQALPDVRIQVRAANGQLAAAGTTNAAGEFSFVALHPAMYTVEIVNAAGEIVGIASVSVVAGSTATVALTAAAVGAITAAATGGAGLLGLGTLGTVAVLGAAGAAAVTAVVATKKDASPSK